MVDRKHNNLSKLTVNNIGEANRHFGLVVEKAPLEYAWKNTQKSNNLFQSVIRYLCNYARKMTENSQGCCLPILKTIREPLVEYQEKRGISNAQETQTYFALLCLIAQMIVSVLVALFQMIQNLAPLLDALLLIVRYIIDKTIEILEAEEDRTMKLIIFALQFITLFVILIVINGLIIIPLLSLFMVIIYKLRRLLF